MEIQASRAQAIFDNFQVGDIVQIIDAEGEAMGIVVKKTVFPSNYGIETLIIGGDSYHFRWDGKCVIAQLIKLHFVTSDLINNFKFRLQWANQYHNPKVDNLTYIEILARLREYEQRI